MRATRVRKVRSDIGKKRGVYTGEKHQVKTNNLLQEKVLKDYKTIERVVVMNKIFDKITIGNVVRFVEVK